MKILLILILSIGAGVLLRRVRQLRYLQYTSTWTVWALLLVFGFTLGSNEALVRDFPRLGLTAFCVAFAGVAGSVLAAWGIGRFLDRKPQEMRIRNQHEEDRKQQDGERRHTES